MTIRDRLLVTLGFYIAASIVVLAGFSLIQLLRTADITWMLGMIPFAAMLALQD